MLAIVAASTLLTSKLLGFHISNGWLPSRCRGIHFLGGLPFRELAAAVVDLMSGFPSNCLGVKMYAFVLVACFGQSTGETESEELCVALRAGFAQWQAGLDFKSDCEWNSTGFQTGVAAAGFNWNWHQVASEHHQTSRGFVAKRDRRVRVFMNPGTPPAEVGGSDGFADTNVQPDRSVSMLKGVGFDELSNGRHEWNRPSDNSRSRLLDRVLVENTVNEYRQIPPLSTLGSIGEITPVRPSKMYHTDPFEMQGPHEAKVPIISRSVVTKENGNFLVTLEARRGNHTTRRFLEFDASDEHLLVSIVEEYAISNEGVAKLQSDRIEVEITDFLTLPQGSVPRRIRHKMVLSNGAELYCEYSSTLTSKSEDSDFRMQIPKGIPIWGVRDPERFAKLGYIDLDLLKAEDVPPVRYSQEPLNSKSALETPQVSTTRWVMISALNIGCIVMVLALLLFYRRTKAVGRK